MIYLKCSTGDHIIELFYDYILNIKWLAFVAYLRHGYILYARSMRVDLFHRWSYLQPCVRCGCPEWHRGVNGSRDVTCHDIWSHWPIFCTSVAFNEHFNLTKPLYWLYHFIFQIRSSSSFPFLKDITIKLCPLQSSAAFVYGAMSFTEKLANGLAVVLIQRYNPWYELFTQIAKVSKRHYFLLLFDIFKNIHVRNAITNLC